MIAPTNQESIAKYLLHCFDDFDIVELRLLRGKSPNTETRKYWTTPIEFDGLLDELETANRQGWNIYIGPNPRKERGKSGDANVAIARCLFADFDGLDGNAEVMIAEAMRRIEAAKLPNPTMSIFSGHGIHTYWRLIEPVTDLTQWTVYQKGLIRVLNSDKAIHNPERIMRLPGFVNHKNDPVVCTIMTIEDSIHAS